LQHGLGWLLAITIVAQAATELGSDAHVACTEVWLVISATNLAAITVMARYLG
jgi:hypothetical protein